MTPTDLNAGLKTSPAPLDGLSSSEGRFAIIASRFNGPIVEALLEGALRALADTGTSPEQVDIVRVPGAFELPLAAAVLADSEEYDGLIALGCVIRGETPHFDHVSRAAADGLQRVTMDFGVPVGFGVLTTEDAAQAHARSGTDPENNGGYAAAMAAIEMCQLLEDF